MNKELKPIQVVLGNDGNPVFTNFGTIEDIKARYAAMIEEEVTRIAAKFSLSYEVACACCQVLCSHHADPAAETLFRLNGGEASLQSEFLAIIQEQAE